MIYLLKQATATGSAVMEAENHVKHGASSKSLMSRGNFLKTCFALLAAGVIILASCSAGGNSKSERWEYKVLSGVIGGYGSESTIRIDDKYVSMEDTLNILGAEGWELISLGLDNRSSSILTFKRKLP